MNWRTRTESRFERMGDTITTYPKIIILIMLVFSFMVISNLPKITIDTSTEGFLHEDDPALVRYEKFKEQFGQDERIMMVVRSKNIFEMKNLEKLRELHQELENGVPHLTDITSLINARNTRGEGDQLIVEDLFYDWPQNETQLQVIKEIAVKSEMYKNLLISDDLTLTTIILEPNAYESTEGGDDLEGFGDEEEAAPEAAEFLKDTSKVRWYEQLKILQTNIKLKALMFLLQVL